MSIEAMKLALEALETLDSGDTYKTHNAATALRQAIEQAQKQEPVAWMYPDDLKRFKTSEAYAQAYSIEMVSPTQGETVPLYTSLTQRQWVSLTPEEVKEISLANRPYVVDMVVALEAKLKEKNHG